MSLRLRVILLVALVLFVSMALGAAVVGVKARRVLDAELDAGLIGARQTVASAYEDLPQSDHPARDLRQLVATFDGNRHVQAQLVLPGGKVAFASHTQSLGLPPPGWFAHLLALDPPDIALPVPHTGFGPATLILNPTPALDVRAAWSEFLALIGGLVSMAVIGLVMVYLVIGAAFRPFTVLAQRFGQIGAGDYTGRVEENGPPELRRLQQGFNRMAAQLAASTTRNHLLTEQMVRLQEEERADIARDLHDEIGPHLFAVSLDAEMIARLQEAGDHAAVAERLQDIQSAVRHMQMQVRDLLGRLRPTQVTEFGLKVALEDLLRFWHGRQPGIAFTLSLPAETLPETCAEVAYRIVQESVNNAVRHGRPHNIAILIRLSDGALEVMVKDDGAGTGAASSASGSGLGLVGMRERVQASGGTLTYGPDRDGWTVKACLGLTKGVA
ncbi:MAG: HAMP domain-containing protein [Sphingomonadales bacterium]|nr:HAMP domain-containing protein [Sphingomonadales bacterium]MDE2172262.1 HAMP domain-containing protein [Sphingomonadales bacterium]